MNKWTGGLLVVAVLLCGIIGMTVGVTVVISEEKSVPCRIAEVQRFQGGGVGDMKFDCSPHIPPVTMVAHKVHRLLSDVERARMKKHDPLRCDLFFLGWRYSSGRALLGYRCNIS